MTRGKDPNDMRMSFGDHLDELRSCLIKAMFGVLAATILCLMTAQHVFSFVMRPAFVVLARHGQNTSLQSLSPPDSFLLYLKLAILSGLILSSPWVFIQFWKFVASGLYPREQRYVRAAVFPSVALFLLGVGFMYYIVLPIVLNFFASFNQQFPVPDWELSALEKRLVGGAEPAPEISDASGMQLPVLNGDPAEPQPGTVWFNQLDNRIKLQTTNGTFEVQTRNVTQASAISNQYSIDFYASFVLRMPLAFGLAFQVPIVVVFLARSGLVPRERLASGRRYVILGFTIGAALLTPPDVVSQILLAIPMVLLFELGLLVSRALENKQARADEHQA